MSQHNNKDNSKKQYKPLGSSTDNSTTNSTQEPNTQPDNPSTSTTASTPNKDSNAEENTQQITQIDDTFTKKHPLQNKWTLWYDNPQKKATLDNWADFLQKIVDFDTVEDFWRLYNNIIKASNLANGGNYHLFKFGVEPKWEDKANEKGGKWIINSPTKQRDNLDKMWLYTMLACVGEAFGDNENEICGAVVSIRKSQDRIALWTRTATNETACTNIGQIFKAALEVSDKVKIGYQSHGDAIRRNSSFNNKSRYEV